jgi:diacylglycerol kinase family enzyme
MRAGKVERTVLVVNPQASRVTPDRVAQVERILRSTCQVETVFTTAPLDAIRIAEDVSGDDAYDTLFVYSGDGGFNEVLNGAGPELALGFIPGGRTNVLPRALGIGRNPLAAAARLAESAQAGRRRRISVGRANGRRFGFASGVGLDAELVRMWEGIGRRRDGRKRGDIVFSLAALRVFWKKRGAIAPALEISGAGPAASAVAANGDPYTYLGPAPLHLAPQTSFEAGIDVVGLRELTPARLPGLAAFLISGRESRLNGDLIRLRDVERVEVTCSRPLPFHVDGEDLGDVMHATFESERNAVEVIV